MFSKDDEQSKIMRFLELRLKRSSFIRKNWWKLHSRFPNIYYSPFYKKTRNVDEREIRLNQESKIPDDESAKVLAFWVNEAYGPSEIEALYHGLKKLGWDQERLDGRDTDCVTWLKNQRQVGSISTNDLGAILRQEDIATYTSHHRANLPTCVDYLLFKLDHVCPSLTFIQVGFVLKSSFQHIYEKELMLDRVSYREPIKERTDMYLVMNPANQKRKAIEAKRAEFNQMAVDWIQSHFPGIFCNGPFKPPTAELIVTRNVMLFEHARETFLHGWSRLLTQVYSHDSWKNKSLDSIHLGVHENDDPDSLHIVVSLPTERLASEVLKRYSGSEGPDTQAYVSLVENKLEGLLTRYAIRALLNSFRQSLMLARDKIKAHSPQKRGVIRSLNDIQRFFSSSLQVPSIIGEISVLTKKPEPYRWECGVFIQTHPLEGNDPRVLAENLASSANYVADHLLQDDKATRDSFKQISEVISARESVNAQRRMEFLTFIAIFLASSSVWLALDAVFKAKIMNFFRTLLHSFY